MAGRSIRKGRGGARPAETAEGVLRRLLKEQMAVVTGREPAAAGGSVEALHDIRVALRRMRSLAATFLALDEKFLRVLDRRVSKVCDRMGDARDLDVWMGLFRDMVREGGMEEVPVRDRRAVLAMLGRERTRLAADALACGAFRRVKKTIQEHLRRRGPARKAAPPEVFVARRMLAVRELIEERHRRVGNFSKGPAHDLRRAARRMRYLAEFFAEGMGRDGARAGRWITKAQAALGKVHDCDSALELSKDLPTGKARAAVRRSLKRRRAAQLRKFKAAWRRYADRRLQKAWGARLEALAAG